MNRWRWIVCAALAGCLIFNPARHDASGQSRPAKVQPEPPKTPEPSELSGIRSQLERIARALEADQASRNASDDKDHDKRDLAAQESMAVWAESAFFVSLFAAILSAIGLVMLWRSLLQTRTAIQDNRDIGEAQTRAYLSMTKGVARISEKMTAQGADGREVVWLCIDGSITVRNTGNTPARFSEALIKAAWTTERYDGYATTTFANIADVPGQSTRKFSFNLSWPDPQENRHSVQMEEFWAEVEIFGKDVFGKPIQTDALFARKFRDGIEGAGLFEDFKLVFVSHKLPDLDFYELHTGRVEEKREEEANASHNAPPSNEG